MTLGRHRIATILPLELEYSGRLLEGALQYAREHRRVTLVDLSYHVDKPARLPIRSPFPFAAALIWANPSASWVERLLAHGVPLISASGDWPAEKVPCIAFDSQAIVEAAVSHLSERRIASMLHVEFFLTGLPAQERRSRWFRQAATRRGIPASSVELFRLQDADADELARRQPLQGRAARLLREALGKLSLPAGVWCGDDLAARRVCEMALAAGLRIPEDIAILGLGNYRAAECGSPQISSIPLLGEQIGYRAFAALDRMLAGESALPQLTAVPPPPVVVRESTAGTSPHDPLQSSRQFISDHCSEGITVKQVASVAGLTPQIFHVRFLTKFGCSPGEAIRQARLAVAKRYLQDPRLSILRVADLCGFNQQSKFSNFFRRETGRSPREWRKRNQ